MYAFRIGPGSNNKFYQVQLIHEWGQYKVFRKWGRVGAANPQSYVEVFSTSLEGAKQAFQSRFMGKSGNKWPLAKPFEKKKGKYVLVGEECDYCVRQNAARLHPTNVF